MPLRSILAFICVLSISFTTSPSYAGDIISCDSYENYTDGSEALTNTLLVLQNRMDALEADNEALRALLAGKSHE